MRKKQIFVLLIVFLFINVAGVTFLFSVKADTNNFVLDGDPVFKRETNPRELEGISGTPRFAGMVWEGAGFDDGNGWEVPVIDDYLGGFYNLTFEKIITGTHGNIWIGMSPDVWVGDDPGEEYQDHYIADSSDPANDTWYFAYPWSWQGIPNNYSDLSEGYYLYPDYYDWITREQLQYVMDEFDNNIHDTDTSYFGMYADRPGPLNDHKIQILIFNIRDGLFYDPEFAPWFIEGYFWSYASETNNANIFHMDVYQWWRRLGDNPVPPAPYQDLSQKPNEYEGTFAHEFQHLIHYDVDSDELSWVNEGCSTLAEWLCGYGFSPGHISEYLINFWQTSLTIWGSELADYGASFLFTFYMYEHYGGAALIWDLVHEQANGIEGWNKVIKKYAGWWKDFDDIFQDWAIANYLDDTSFGHGKYGYYALDIPSADTEFWDIPYAMFLWDYYNPGYFNWFVSSYPHSGYDYPYGASPPYVVNYVEFHPGEYTTIKVEFDGDDYTGIAPYSGSYEWHSDGETWSWFSLGQSFTVSEPDAWLKFWTYYEIETDWDYGYVEVYDHDEDQWFTLPGNETTHTLPNAQENAYAPDEREPWMYYYYYGSWNALTGFSPGWYQETMNLSRFSGHTIDLYFTYWTDGLYQELGWYIDDIEVTGVTPSLFDDVESGEGDWEVNYGWYITDGLIENDFKVSFLEFFNFYTRKGNLYRTYNWVSQMRINGYSETGHKYISLLDRKRMKTWALMVVALQPGYEHTFSAGYSFTADRLRWCCCWCRH